MFMFLAKKVAVEKNVVVGIKNVMIKREVSAVKK